MSEIKGGSLWVSKEYRAQAVKRSEKVEKLLAAWPRVEVAGEVRCWGAHAWVDGVGYMSGGVFCAMPKAVFLRTFERVEE